MVSDNGQTTQQQDQPQATIRVVVTPTDDGPYEVEGPLTLIDEDGEEWNVSKRKTVYLCRCGRSNRKPFCDGSHDTTGFESTVRASKPVAF